MKQKVDHTIVNLRMHSSCIYFYYLFLIVLTQVGCRKFVEIEAPTDKITQQNVFLTDRSATTVLTEIYSSMSRSGADIAKYCGLLADEWTLWAGADINNIAYYTNSLYSTAHVGSTGKEVWNSYYNYIFQCNSAIEGIINNDRLSTYVRKQLLGEAYFMRAWFYSSLVNLYGRLPLVLGTDPETNRLLPQSPVEEVYLLIKNDLLKAQDLLNENYVNGQLMAYPESIERVRPTKWAATALLSRIYLYNEEWAKAEEEASKVITHTTLFTLTSLNEVFLKNSQEAIWQLQPIDVGWNTNEGRTFHLSAFPSGLSFEKPVHLSPFVLDAFETGDERRIQWMDSLDDGTGVYYFPVKYKVAEENPGIADPSMLTEYSMMLRLSEQYLIRAEARARQNKINEAIADVDIIRGRANLPLIANTNSTIDQDGLLNAILHERQVELFTESGHRWFDMKRFGKVDEVMGIVTPAKGGSWELTDQLLPIPYNELLFNPTLIQNSGY